MDHGQVGKELIWDTTNMRFTNDEEANKNIYIRRGYRKEWATWDLKEFPGELLS
jgi:hypothetical protein